MTVRIAMWSGPRNISTAMMRSWENRPDCSVVDEPFYAAYLAQTGLEHPCREEILRAQSSDYDEVVAALTSEAVPTALYYQKQMTHHIPRGMDMSWCAAMRHCFLIRDPAQVIASYVKKMPWVDEDAIGIRRQAELFEQITAVTGVRPAVIDAADVLADPEQTLAAVCAQLGVSFDADTMLHWPPGMRASDGVWAAHWYANVAQSTGFGEPVAASPALNEEQAALADAMAPCYEALAQYRLRP